MLHSAEGASARGGGATAATANVTMFLRLKAISFI
jgi:hypothetical protein